MGLQNHGTGYGGNERHRALPLRHRAVLLGFPGAVYRGRLSARDFWSPEVRAWVDGPKIALLPQSCWLPTPPRATVRVPRPVAW